MLESSKPTRYDSGIIFIFVKSNERCEESYILLADFFFQEKS